MVTTMERFLFLPGKLIFGLILSKHPMAKPSTFYAKGEGKNYALICLPMV